MTTKTLTLKLSKLLLLCALTPMTACVAVVQGDGNRREETRDVGEFSKLDIGHGFEAVATLGSPASVKIEGDGNVLPHVDARVVDGRLVVDAPDGTLLMPRIPVKVTIVSPTLTSVEASGAAKVTAQASAAEAFVVTASGGSKVSLSGLSSQRLDAKASGGSHLRIVGTAREVSVELSGASRIDSDELPAETLRIDASGTSSGTARASASVTGALSGGSHLTVMGRPPMVQVNTSGGSSYDLVD